MLLYLESEKLRIDSHLKGEFSKKSFGRQERVLFQSITDWLNEEKESFSFQTSGSTGKPKTITLDRKVIRYSAIETLKFLGLNLGGRSLLCISPEFIGGFMVIVRAILNRMDIEYIPPSKSIEPSNTIYHLTSMVPIQVYNTLKKNPEYFDRFDNILIGGAHIDHALEKELLSLNARTKFYSTYGMTETSSHIALRKIGETCFEALGDARFKTNENGCLCVLGTVTNNKWLETNDIVELKSDKLFKWVGRWDFIINTGGIKVIPEKVESLLQDRISKPFMIGSIPDKELGNKVVLIVEDTQNEFTFDNTGLSKYEVPKETFTVDRLIYNESGKINRKASQNLILNQVERQFEDN